jgi:FkbM family methyltransferase
VTLVSFAQHGEDVVLHRALGNVTEGFWVDVGAGDPEVDSVTALFAGLGWRGINIEPEPEACARLAAARPRDITLCCAAGAAPGQAILHRIPGTGLSTLDPAIAARHAAEGHRVEPVPVEIRTLADICDAHAPATIHFLKIDAEGHEAAVLAGANFTRHRPWVVVVEATEPNRPVPSESRWEPGLLAAGYDFVRFDGLNRWYVAAEHAAVLAGALALPPSPLDGFVRLAELRAVQRAEAAEASAREATLRERAEREAAERRAAEAYRRAELAEAARAAAEAAAAAAAEREAAAVAAREAAERLASRAEGRAAAAEATLARLECRLAAAEEAARAASAAQAALAAARDAAEAEAAAARAAAAASSGRVMAAAQLAGSLARRLAETEAAAREAAEQVRRHAEAEARAVRALAQESVAAAAARTAADEIHRALEAMARRAGEEWQRAEALARQVAALRASRSWRITRPFRVVGWLLRGHPGAALIEAGAPAAWVERLAAASGRGLAAPIRALAFLAGEAVASRPALQSRALAVRSRLPWLIAWAERRWRSGRDAAIAAAEPRPGPGAAAEAASLSPQAARALRRIRLLRGEAGG